MSGPTTLAPGDELRLTATVRDSLGRTLTDRAVFWSSSDRNVVSVTATEGLVVGVSAGSAMITATADGVSGGVSVAGSFVNQAYAVNTDPSPASQYTPTYRNLTGGAATVRRWSTGFYTVYLDRLGTGSLGATAVAKFVSAIYPGDTQPTNAPETVCLVTSGIFSAPLNIDVRCWNVTTKQPADSRFRVVGVANGVLAGPAAPFVQSAFSTYDGDGEPNPLASWTSTNSAMSIASNTPVIGHFRHQLGLVLGLPYVSLAGTTLGSLHSCQLTAPPAAAYTDVICLGTNDTPSTSSTHTVLTMQAGRPGTPWGYVHNTAGQVVAHRSASSSGQLPSIVRVATGRYRVTFGGVVGQGSTPAIVITPVNAQTWTPCSHALTASSPITVEVSCFAAAGQLVDVDFVLAVWH